MFKHLILSNRSCLGWDPARKVTREELVDMIDCARLSASSINLQPLKFHPVYEGSEVKLVRERTFLARGHFPS